MEKIKKFNKITKTNKSLRNYIVKIKINIYPLKKKFMKI